MGSPVNLDILFLIIFAFLPITLSISVFLSVLIHEMAHAYVANKKGYKVYGIEIGLFAGSAAIDTNMHERDSIPVVAAGPISNLFLYSISLIINTQIENQFLTDMMMINLFLFLFNILPIYPMDGGHIVRDFLVLKLNRRMALNISGKISLIFSTLLLFYSIYNAYLIMTIFSILFIYKSFKTLKYIK
jgi:stage IV sporulation protein FB